MRKYLFLMSFLCTTPAGAQSYPAKPVRVIVGFAPGGATDIVARQFAQKVGESLGRPFVVENRPGGGGVTATMLVKNAAPDGYLLLGHLQCLSLGITLKVSPGVPEGHAPS